MEVRLLGPVQLWGSDEQIDLGAPQQRCVFAALALTPRQSVSVDALVQRVWGDEVPRNVRAVLYTYVSRLRQLLQRADAGGGRAVLRRRDGGYALELDPDRVDLHRARWLASQARTCGPGGDARAAELFDQACALWSGTPLAGINGDWAERVRIGLEHERLALLTERFDAAIRSGQHDTVIGPLSQALAAHPLTESLAGLLMLALHRSGRHAEALAVYTQLRRRLVDEVGNEPGPALRRMHEQILRRDPGLELSPPTMDTVPDQAATVDHTGATDLPDGGTGRSAPQPTATGPPSPATVPWIVQYQLPPDVWHFLSRDEQITRLLAALRPDGDTTAVPIATITGPPGVGKTALAIRVAQQVRDQYPDGQWYVRLDGASTGRDPDVVAADLLEASGMDAAAVPRGLDRRAAALRSRLADRRVLLLLDDAADTAQIRPLLPGTTGAAVLVTSRRLLTGLAASTTVRLDPLDHADALSLLGKLAGTGRISDDPHSASEISNACGRLPLALCIAGARLAAHPEWTVERYATKLRDQHRRLDELATDDLAIRPTLQLSYHALHPHLRTALRRLGLVTTDLAAWTLGTLTDHPDGEHLIDGLLAANLLDTIGTDPTGEPRYRLHDLVATYASELASRDDPDETTAALHRHLDALLTLTAAAHGKLPAATDQLPPVERDTSGGLPEREVTRLTADPMGWLVAERTHLVTAIERACQLGWHDDAALLADRALIHLSTHIGSREAERLYGVIRDAARRAGDELVAWRAESHRYAFAGLRGGVTEVGTGMLDCAAAFERLGARAELAFSLAGAAVDQFFLNDLRGALSLAQRAVDVAETCGERRIEASAAVELAGVLAHAGRLREALSLFDRALKLADDLDLAGDKVVILMRLAAAAMDGGDIDRADTACRQAIALIDETIDPRGMAYLLNRSARIATAQGRPHDAIRAADDAIGRFARVGDARGEATATLSAAQARLAAGHPETAVPLLESASRALHELSLHGLHEEAQRTLVRAYAARRDSCRGATAYRPATVGPP